MLREASEDHGDKGEKKQGAVHIRHHVDLASRTLVVFVELSTRKGMSAYLRRCSLNLRDTLKVRERLRNLQSFCALRAFALLR